MRPLWSRLHISLGLHDVAHADLGPLITHAAAGGFSKLTKNNVDKSESVILFYNGPLGIMVYFWIIKGKVITTCCSTFIVKLVLVIGLGRRAENTIILCFSVIKMSVRYYFKQRCLLLIIYTNRGNSKLSLFEATKAEVCIIHRIL